MKERNTSSHSSSLSLQT